MKLGYAEVFAMVFALRRLLLFVIALDKYKSPVLY